MWAIFPSLFGGRQFCAAICAEVVSLRMATSAWLSPARTRGDQIAGNGNEYRLPRRRPAHPTERLAADWAYG